MCLLLLWSIEAVESVYVRILGNLYMNYIFDNAAARNEATASETLLRGIKKTTYSEQVVDYIKQSLLNGELMPGDQIKEVEFSQKLGISRAPIREAMQQLVREGLVQSQPQKGKYISALTSKEIMDSYFTGGVLEGAAVAQVLSLYTSEDFRVMEDLVGEMRRMVTPGADPEQFVPLDNAFHAILFSRVDNELVIELCRRACQGISKFLLYKFWVKVYTPQEFYDRHHAIFKAMKGGDALEVESVIRGHYTDSGKRMAQYGVDRG